MTDEKKEFYKDGQIASFLPRRNIDMSTRMPDQLNPNNIRQVSIDASYSQSAYIVGVQNLFFLENKIASPLKEKAFPAKELDDKWSIQVISKPMTRGNIAVVSFNDENGGFKRLYGGSRGLFVVELSPQKYGYKVVYKKTFDLFDNCFHRSDKWDYGEFYKYTKSAKIGNIIVLSVKDAIVFSDVLIDFLRTKGAEDPILMTMQITTPNFRRTFRAELDLCRIGYALIYKVLPAGKGERLEERCDRNAVLLEYRSRVNPTLGFR